MENKKSFILHYDSLKVLEQLSDEQAGKLLKKMHSYHNGNTYICDDNLVNVLFIQFENQFDRDMEKYENVCSRNKKNIEKRYATKSTTGKSGIPKSTKSTDNGNDSGNGNGSKKDKDIITTDFFTQENKELCWYIYSIWNLEKREVVDEVEKMRLWLIDKDRTTKNWKLFTINWMKRTPKRPKPLEITAVVETLETHGPSMEELEGKTENFSNILKQF